MPYTLNDLPIKEKEHWQLHLNAVLKDNPVNSTVYKDAQGMLNNGELPNIKHPAYIHDWLEQPERRAEIEAYDG